MPSEKTAEMREFEAWFRYEFSACNTNAELDEMLRPDRDEVEYADVGTERDHFVWQAACAATAARVRRDVVEECRRILSAAQNFWIKNAAHIEADPGEGADTSFAIVGGLEAAWAEIRALAPDDKERRDE